MTMIPKNLHKLNFERGFQQYTFGTELNRSNMTQLMQYTTNLQSLIKIP